MIHTQRLQQQGGKILPFSSLVDIYLQFLLSDRIELCELQYFVTSQTNSLLFQNLIRNVIIPKRIRKRKGVLRIFRILEIFVHLVPLASQEDNSKKTELHKRQRLLFLFLPSLSSFSFSSLSFWFSFLLFYRSNCHRRSIRTGDNDAAESSTRTSPRTAYSSAPHGRVPTACESLCRKHIQPLAFRVLFGILLDSVPDRFRCVLLHVDETHLG